MDSTSTSATIINNNSNNSNNNNIKTIVPPPLPPQPASLSLSIPQQQQQQHELIIEKKKQIEEQEIKEENQNNKLKQKLVKINNLAQPKRDELYWCWTLKEYIRLGHIKSIFRILKIIDHQNPYIYQQQDDFNNTIEITTPSSTTNQPLLKSRPPLPPQPTSQPTTQPIPFTYYFESKAIIDPKRSSFPYLYIPNILRQKSFIFLYLNSKSLSISNILHHLKIGNIDSLMIPNYLPIPKSLPVVPFLLVIIYFKLCLSKGDSAKSIIDSLLECRDKIELLPIYDDKSIPPIKLLLDSILNIRLRFIDWLPDSSSNNQLIPTEVYFNEIFEVIYLNGRDSFELPQQAQPQRAQHHHHQTILSNPPIISDDNKFKIIDIYLKDSRKLVYLNIGSLAQKRGTMNLQIWSKENILTLIKCCKFYLQVNNNLNHSGNGSNSKEEITTKDDIITILDCCMRLAFSWATICSGIIPNSQEKYSDLDQCWWNIDSDQLQIILRDWIQVIKRIFLDINSKNSDKLHLVCLVWLASTISLFDDDEEQQQQQQVEGQGQLNLPQKQLIENSYTLYIKNISNHPELLLDFTKSSLVITSIGFALIGVQTLDQTIELIQKLINLWGNNNKQQQQQQQSSTSSLEIPSLENVCLIFKTIQNVLTTKFKLINFNNQDELSIALISWLRCITDEIYNLFYSSNLNSRFLCIFIGSSLVHAIKRNKNICTIVPDDVKKDIVGRVQELFYTLINQHNFLPKPFKIGLATAYCLASIDPFTEKQANQSILMISLDILLDEILCINGSLNNWLENTNEINTLIIKKIESHKTTPLFLSIPPFIQTISGLILNLHDNDNNKLVLLKLCDFTYSLNEKWSNYSNDSFPSPPIPKSMIRKSLDPTFQAIFQSLSLLFNEISPILTPMDSVVGIELFCKLTFISNEDDVQSISKSIRSLAKNILVSECAIIRFIDKMPLYYQVAKDDKIACLQVVIYFYALDCLITLVPHNLIVDHIVPNLFEYMEYPNSKLNTQSHSILAKMFSIPNFHLSIKMVPMYLKSALKTFPKFTKVSSLYEVLVSIIENNAPTNPIILYSIKTISQSAIEHMITNNNTVSNNSSSSNTFSNSSSNNNNSIDKIQDSSSLINHTHKKLKDSSSSSSSKQFPQQLNIAAKGLIKVLISLFLYIDIQIIEIVLDEIRKVIIKAPNQKIRLELCSELLSEITSNLENNTKKNICISWYLGFIHEIENLNNNFLIQSTSSNLNNNNNIEKLKNQK